MASSRGPNLIPLFHVERTLNTCLFFRDRVKAKLQETSPERVEPFMANAPAEVKKILGNIKNFQVTLRGPRPITSAKAYDDDDLRTPLEVTTSETKSYPECDWTLKVTALLSQSSLWPKSPSVQFFTGESMNPDGSIGLLDFREDGVTPYMLFFKDGLEIEKCVSDWLKRCLSFDQ